MTDGYWRIKQYSPTTKTGFTTTEITVKDAPGTKAETIPHYSISSHGIAFLYPDGHVDHYPWASIVKAEYQPPTQGDKR